MNNRIMTFLMTALATGAVCAQEAPKLDPAKPPSGVVEAVVAETSEGRASLRNGLVEIVFDLGAGTYRIADLRDAAASVRDARHRAADKAGVTWDAAQPGAKRTVAVAAVDGPLGKGRALTVTTTIPDGPALLLEIALHEGSSFVAMRGGLVNRTAKPIQLARIHPCVGVAFKGLKTAERYAVLDGDTGCVPTRLWTDAQVKCRNNLLATFGGKPSRCLAIGGLTYNDFEKFAQVHRRDDSLEFDVWSEDPVGRRVDPGERYLPDDAVYVDVSSQNPFAALEAYAWSVRRAQRIDLPTYDIPTVCLWWASHYGPKANDTIGAVREMDHIVKSGFLKYSRVGVRLLPDSYDKNNCDGWWDDAHWAKCPPTFADPGPCYKPPYETTKKWCQAILERGGVPIGYMRTNGRSEDYAKAFPGHMLFNDPARQIKTPFAKRWWEKDWPAGERDLVGYDFTDPDFLKHMREVYANLKEAGLAGLFYDYPKVTGWCHEGGFEDPKATTAIAYRNIFKVAQEGLGKGALLQERPYFFGSDVSLGTVASQRTIWDNTVWSPAVISRAGLRWYKNRVVMNYDTDGKQVLDEFSRNGQDGVRAMFTMSYVASARVLIANSFSQMTPEQLFDLSRVIPLHATPQSARPLDLFNGGNPYPRVYDFRVDDRWHQLTLYNTAVESGEWPSIDVSLEVFTEGRRDYRGKVRKLKPVASTVSVELGAPPAEGGLGLDRDVRYYVYDFWNEKLVGVFKGSDRLDQQLRPSEARMMSVHAVEPNPQFLSTNRHVMQGYVDLTRRPAWDAARGGLAGTSKVVGGETYKVILAANGYRVQGAEAAGAQAKVRVVDETNGLLELSLDSEASREVAWTVTFDRR